MKTQSRIKICLMGLAMITALTGCAVSQAPKYTDFGETYRHAKDSATVADPTRAKGMAQDGQLMQKVLENYRKDVGAPETVDKTLTTGTTGK